MYLNQNYKKMVLGNFVYNPTRILVFAISIMATIYIAYNVNHSGYNFLYLLPLIYGVIFVFFISPALFKNNNLFLSVFTAVTFSRYIILPVLIVYTSWYEGRSAVPPLDSSYRIALLLMIYELVIVSFFVFILFNKKSFKKNRVNSIAVPKNKFIYLLFITFSIFLLFISPDAIKTFAFFMPTENTIDLGKGSTLSSVTFYFLLTSKYLIFLLLLSFFYRKYCQTKNIFFIFFAFIVIILNIVIIFGDNRADFIITAIVTMSLFYKMFPREGKVASVVLILLVVFITTSITDYRGTVTQTEGENVAVDVADTLQIYLGGPYNVAIAIESANANPDARNLVNFSYEMLRPVMGINLLLKNVDLEISNFYFNKRIFFSDHYSQINPIIGQGYFYFGFFGAPILMVLFLFFVRFLINVLSKISRIELIFFLTIPITRIGLAMGQNATILINDATFFLFLNIFIYLLNNKIVLKKTRNLSD